MYLGTPGGFGALFIGNAEYKRLKFEKFDISWNLVYNYQVFYSFNDTCCKNKMVKLSKHFKTISLDKMYIHLHVAPACQPE